MKQKKEKKQRHLKKPTRRQVLRFLLNSLIIVFGNAVAAAASAFFIGPNHFVMGGTTGFGIFVENVLTRYTTFSETATLWARNIAVYAINITLFIVGAILLGKKLVVTTLAGTLLYPSFLSLFTLANNVYLDAHAGQPVASEDPMLAAFMGALLFGFGVGIVIRVGASTGGTDIPALIFHKLFATPVSVTLWICDFTIVALNLIAVDIDRILYGVVITLISSVVVDKVTPIGMRRTQVKIVSAHYKEIRDMILTKISRGVTVLYGQTGYLKKDCHMLLTVISHRQLVTLKAEVRKIDPEAFMTISVVSEVRGRGFQSEGVEFLLPREKEENALPPAPDTEEEHAEDRQLQN